MTKERPYQVFPALDRSVISVRFKGAVNSRVLQTVKTVYGMNGDYRQTGPIKDEDGELVIYERI